MRTASRLVLAACLLTLPTVASAAGIYLNGTRVDGAQGLGGLKIDKCAVEFDQKGDVHLDCPGYQIKLDGGQAPRHDDDTGAAATGTISKHYFLVSEQAVQGATEFDIDVFVNSKFIRTLKNNDEQLVEDITKHLKPGKNTVTLTAHKRIAGKDGARKSFSPQHTYRVIIGEGASAGDKVMIDDAVISFERNAAEDKDVSQDFALTTH